MKTDAPFWRTQKLEEMTAGEWESLCDGCGLCCLNKLEEEDTGEITFTSSACEYLNLESCRCADYANRRDNVPECVTLTPELVRRLAWLPDSCAYRLVAEGRDLYGWHRLVSGDAQSVHAAGISTRGRCASERSGEDLEDCLIDWVRPGGPLRPVRPVRPVRGRRRNED